MTHAACYQAFGRDFYVEPASAQHANAVFQDEYKIRDLRQHNVRTILDVGAHVGSFTVLCHEFWPTRSGTASGEFRSARTQHGSHS